MIKSPEGQTAMIGIGFDDRNDAFDFCAGVDDYKKQIRITKGIDTYDVTKTAERDFSLKEG